MNKLALIAVLIMFFTISTTAQEKKIPPSLLGSVSQHLGLETVVTFEFSRPGVKGRTIWGDLVPYGLTPGNKYSDNKPFPWRAGANKNSTIETNKDILVEGKKLPAGKYGIHMIPGEKEFVVMFSKTDSLWGSYQYKEADDALRITVATKAAPHEEWLTFGFDDLAGTSATAYLHWDKLMVPFKIEITE
ncbi:MAG: DUF2911 domain-containing protein [Ignavibacteriae bacterium]|nr:DUF2911 domain-containing protein [Ignavibacteriota bacterium]